MRTVKVPNGDVHTLIKAKPRELPFINLPLWEMRHGECAIVNEEKSVCEKAVKYFRKKYDKSARFVVKRVDKGTLIYKKP